MRAPRGDALYALVEEYAALGDHVTGTPVDAATCAWFAEQLDARGATVELEPYEFDRYVADARVAAGGRDVRCLPLFYSGIGTVDTDAPFVTSFDPGGGAGPHVNDALDGLLAAARDAGCDVVVLATGGDTGRLVAINRPPTEPTGPVAVMIAGADRGLLERGDVRVAVEAGMTTGRSSTVVARLGAAGDDASRVLLTTPLSGWFACAGERGTGIAVALELAPALADAGVPVTVVGTTGHEIGFLGLHAHLARDPTPHRLVLHLGASLAAGDGHELGVLRGALVDGIAPPVVDALRAELAPARLAVAPWDPSIPGDAGEGSVWRGRSSPVVSILGVFDRFHTPDDVPEAVTSPALLETVAGALVRAVRMVVAA